MIEGEIIICGNKLIIVNKLIRINTRHVVRIPPMPSSVGVVAAIRFAFSISRKPFNSYDFHQQVADLVLCYLQIFPPHSEEILSSGFDFDSF